MEFLKSVFFRVFGPGALILAFGILGVFLCCFHASSVFTRYRYRKTIVCLFFVIAPCLSFFTSFTGPQEYCSFCRFLPFYQCIAFLLYIAAGSSSFTRHQINLFGFIELILIFCTEKTENGIEVFYT